MAESCEPPADSIRLSVIEERLRGDDKEWEVFKRYAEKRWDDLNGEAGRLKTILEASVPRETFDTYKDTQRVGLEQYRNMQAEAFNKYAGEVGLKLEAVNKQLNRWGGGITVLIFVLGMWMKFGGKP